MQSASLEYPLNVPIMLQSIMQGHNLKNTDLQRNIEDHENLLARKAAMKWLLHCLRKKDLKTTGLRVYLGMEHEEEFIIDEYIDKLHDATLACTSNQSFVALSESSSAEEISPNEREQSEGQLRNAENALQTAKDERNVFENHCSKNKKNIEALEQEVQLLSNENMEWQEKIGHLLVENKNLHDELKEMQNLLEKARRPAVRFLNMTAKSDSTLWPMMSTVAESRESLDTALEVEDATIAQRSSMSRAMFTDDGRATTVESLGIITPAANLDDFPSMSRACVLSLGSLVAFNNNEKFVVDEEIPDMDSSDTSSFAVSSTSGSCLTSPSIPCQFMLSSDTSIWKTPRLTSSQMRTRSPDAFVPLMATGRQTAFTHPNITDLSHWLYYMIMGLTYPFLPVTLPMVNWVIQLPNQLYNRIAPRLN